MPPPRNALTVAVDRSSKRNETNNERIFLDACCSFWTSEEEGNKKQPDLKKKKKKNAFSKDKHKRVLSVTQSSGYWSIYIDWQRRRSYHE